MRSTIIPAAVAFGILAAAAAPAGALVPAGTSLLAATTSGITPASYQSRRYARARAYRPYGYAPYAQQGWVPQYLRGFEDPGFAYHGNINGCVSDLGYGRWEPCNRGR
jgi:hypothetical protein